MSNTSNPTTNSNGNNQEQFFKKLIETVSPKNIISRWKNIVKNTSNFLLKWEMTPWVSGFLNQSVYFLLLFGITNILYFNIFDILSPLTYFFICIFIPLGVSILVSKVGIITKMVQKLFFSEKELSLIVLSAIITYALLKIV